MEKEVAAVASLLMTKGGNSSGTSSTSTAASEADKNQPFNYTNSRKIDRPQVQDIISTVFSDFFEMSGDGRVGKDVCIRGGFASFQGKTCGARHVQGSHPPDYAGGQLRNG